MEETSDLDKLYAAFAEITTTFGSVDNILESFGLSQLPTAQRYGIVFGILTFTATITTVFVLLVFGGSFERLAEQAASGEATIPYPHKARAERALLLERLLDARKRMVKQYPPTPMVSVNAFSPLTKLLMNVHPKGIVNNSNNKTSSKHYNTDTAADEKKDGDDEGQQQQQQEIPDGYQQNYVMAYRKVSSVTSFHGRLFIHQCFPLAYFGILNKTKLFVL